MAYLTAPLPVATAIACYAARKNHADTAMHRDGPTATGDCY